MKSWYLLFIKVDGKIKDGCSQESKEIPVSVIGSSHGTATAKLLLCFLVIMA